MKKKELAAAAKSLSDMIVSGRVEGSLEEIVEFDVGVIQIDLLKMTSSDSNAGIITMTVLADLGKWCREKVIATLPDSTIESVLITLDYDSSEVPTNKNKLVFFLLNARCIIKTKDKEHEGHSTNKLWYNRHA